MPSHQVLKRSRASQEACQRVPCPRSRERSGKCFGLRMKRLGLLPPSSFPKSLPSSLKAGRALLRLPRGGDENQGIWKMADFIVLVNQMADLFIYLIVAAKPIICHSSALPPNSLLPVVCPHPVLLEPCPLFSISNGPLPDLSPLG